jgi:epoxyqueuosine reductase QueG
VELLKTRFLQRFSNRIISAKKKKDLTLLKRQIRDYASSLGCVCGFTSIDTRLVSASDRRNFPYKNVVVVGMGTDDDSTDHRHYRSDKLAEFDLDVRLAKKAYKVADFIRARGYKCYAKVPTNAEVKYTPHAINAGLGELGANGLVITREFGPNVRWAVISTCTDIDIDKPIDLNIDAYCESCRLCVQLCPIEAIPVEKIWWRGVLKRKIDDTKCWRQFSDGKWCGICIKICPIGRFGYKECMNAYYKDGTILGKGN